MTVRSRETETVGVWLAGEFAGRLPADAVEDVVAATRVELEGSIDPEALGEMLHRLSRARLLRLLDTGTSVRIPRAR